MTLDTENDFKFIYRLQFSFFDREGGRVPVFFHDLRLKKHHSIQVHGENKTTPT